MKEREEPINWDCEVERIEEAWERSQWDRFWEKSNETPERLRATDPELDELLFEIEKDQDRRNPDGDGAFDHEEVYRATGTYYVISREEGHEGEGE